VLAILEEFWYKETKSVAFLAVKLSKTQLGSENNVEKCQNYAENCRK